MSETPEIDERDGGKASAWLAVVAEMNLLGIPWSKGARTGKQGAVEEIRFLYERAALMRAALRDIVDELEQSNGGKGPELPLNIHILSIARTALSKSGAA